MKRETVMIGVRAFAWSVAFFAMGFLAGAFFILWATDNG